ncbi:hypothetical protein HDU76_007026 [Blyttiomyces sp. JEL0837]|nr:hypothetical protein HDU76_007026 [Blyttiomyces sp. JEL0837]
MSQYEDFIIRLRKTMECDDLVSLVESFRQKEESNFSLFNFVNLSNDEIDKMSREISNLQSQIEDIKNRDSSTTSTNTEKLRGLEDALNVSNEKQTALERQILDSAVMIEELRREVESVMRLMKDIAKLSEDVERKLNPNSEEKASQDGEETEATKIRKAIDQILDVTGVTDDNLLSCLALVEQGTNELLILDNKFDGVSLEATSSGAKEGGAEHSEAPTGGVPGKSLVGYGPAYPIGNVVITNPIQGDDLADDDGSGEDDRPLTREEIKGRVIKTLSTMDKTKSTVVKKTAKKRS